MARLTDLAQVADQIGAATGRPFRLTRHRPVAGGCINTAAILEDGSSRYFVKLNSAARAGMFEAEAAGLAELAAAAAVRAPAPICWGVAGDAAYLVLEYLDLVSGDARFLARLGRELAAMHRVTAARFGWNRDNTIGATPQINTPSTDWADFWRTHRLGYQLTLARRGGFGGTLQRKGQKLIVELPRLFSGYHPQAALLHGDLWGGNIGVLAHGEPVIFDPAVYYGDREADIAMTELFGGFGADFYGAYRESYPLDAGYPVRKHLYNLYHVLNHLNLFGGGYGRQAEHLMDALLSELR